MHRYSVIQKNLMSLFSGKAATVQACWTCGRCTGVCSRAGCLCAGASLSRGGAAPCQTQSVPDGPGAGHSWALGGAGDASGKRDLRKGKPSLAEGGNQCEKQPCEHPGKGGEEGEVKEVLQTLQKVLFLYQVMWAHQLIRRMLNEESSTDADTKLIRTFVFILFTIL